MNSKEEKRSRWARVLTSKWSWLTVLLALVLIYIVSVVSSAITSLNFALTPPEVPAYESNLKGPIHLNSKAWEHDGATSEWFHNASQGTATIPIPYSWLVALEAPKSRPWAIFFGQKGSYIETYLPKVGFIQQEPDLERNPDNLPIGIAKTDSIYFAGLGRKDEAVGFTCAACHTGQIIHDDTRYVIDGGPAMIDLGLFGQTLGAAVGQTALSSQFGWFDGRFTRFAKKVLGSNYNVQTKAKLKKSLTQTIKELTKTSDVIAVTEGFTRLDALNRIGNQVFNAAMDKPENYTPIDAPVNYPHLWTTSWFDWVQYDGSIMQPLIRNTGEALGVQAYLDTEGPNDQRFASSVNVRNLNKVEDWLGGTHPLKNNEFNGLRAPKWPIQTKSGSPDISKESALRGQGLYNNMCKGCHLPSVASSEFWSDKYWKPITYYKDGEKRQTEESFLKLNIIPVDHIGTDPGQAQIIGGRTVDTTGLGLNTEVCTVVSSDLINDGKDEAESAKQVLSYVPLNDSATSTFGFALGAVVERTNEQWFKQNYIAKSEQKILQGNRPNCLQATFGYKARPLNGVWATAPFLHNGSIATVYDLLSTQKQRPTFVQLGSQKFDAKHLGIEQDDRIAAVYQKYLKNKKSYQLTDDYYEGLFILDTRQPGNLNTGHLFDDKEVDGKKVNGRIGRKLNDQEKLDIIEYLKTI